MSDEFRDAAPTPGELEELEERPTGDFIDGFLAGAALLNAAVSGEDPRRFFYSFDWVGDPDSPREEVLAAAFQVAPGELSFETELVRDWRGEADALARRWLARAAPERADAVAAEFVELMEAFLGGGAVEAYVVRPSAAGGDLAARLGAAHDHLLLETGEGRMLLEFSVDV